jgi:hypothetical protein
MVRQIYLFLNFVAYTSMVETLQGCHRKSTLSVICHINYAWMI